MPQWTAASAGALRDCKLELTHTVFDCLQLILTRHLHISFHNSHNFRSTMWLLPLIYTGASCSEISLIHSSIKGQYATICYYLVLWIELSWPENPANTYVRHTETLDSCFDLIRSHQQYIPWSPPVEIDRSNQQPENAKPKLYHWATI